MHEVIRSIDLVQVDVVVDRTFVVFSAAVPRWTTVLLEIWVVTDHTGQIRETLSAHWDVVTDTRVPDPAGLRREERLLAELEAE